MRGEGLRGLGNKGLCEVVFHHLEEATRPFDQTGVRDEVGNVRGVIGCKALDRSILGKHTLAISPRLHM